MSSFAVASDPVITSLNQISATSVGVEWSQPSGGATVTGYVVHYSDGDTDRNESVPASSTCVIILNLNLTITYTFTVEARSEHICGMSKNKSITMTTDYQSNETHAGEMGTCDINSTTENYNISFTVQPTHSTTFNPTEKTSNDIDIALILGILSVFSVMAIFILIIILGVIIFAR